MWVTSQFRLTICTLCVLSNSSQSLQASIPSFTRISDPSGNGNAYATSASANCEVIVGEFRSPNSVAFRWTTSTGIVSIGDLPGGSVQSIALGISGNSTTIVGSSTATVGERAFRWTAAGGISQLSNMPANSGRSSAAAASFDGSVIVGFATTFPFGGPERAFRWTQSTGGQFLSPAIRSQANSVSADGSIVVGIMDEDSDGYYDAFKWTQSTGIVPLPEFSNTAASSAADITPDGQFIAGTCRLEGEGEQSCLWTPNGLVDLGMIPGLGPNWASAVSDDGSVVVGHMAGIQGSFPEAFIWDSGHGMRKVQDLADALGFGNQLLDFTLEAATAISADGRTIVGRGSNGFGETETWILVVPEPSSLCYFAILAAALLVPKRRF